jgi:HTH-type transcriptional regulator/antitoxin HigA
MSGATIHPAAVADLYFDLVRELPLRPIRTKADFRRASKMIDRLSIHDEGTLSPGEQDYLDTLDLLVEEYDRNNRPATQADPIGLLKHLMEESSMTVTALGQLLGSKSVASEILHGKRSLSKTHMAKLAEHFKLDVAAFFSAPQRDITSRAVA